MSQFPSKLLFILLLGIFSCAKSNEETLQTDGQGINTTGCNTASMKFSTDIAPILKANCNGCHNTTSAAAGVNTETYAGVKAIADNKSLVGSITHATGYSPMPKGMAKLSDCDIDKIKAWVAQGARNN